VTNRIISAQVIGTDAVVQRFKRREEKLRTRMRETMADLGEQLRAASAAKAPRGDERQVRHRTTKGGKLAASARLKVFDKVLSVGARVYYKKYYGLWVESGYGPVEERVRGYTRRDPRLNTYQMTKRGLPGKRKASVGIVFVRPFNRTGRAAPHPFLVPTARSMKDSIRYRLEAVINGTIAED
jgi:hypothetical protein